MHEFTNLADEHQQPVAQEVSRSEEAADCCHSAELYAVKCRRFAIPVEASVAAWLCLGGDTLQVPAECSLLPACEFLAQSQTLRKLRLRAGSSMSKGAGNANARVLRHVLSRNTSLEMLDLSYTGLDSAGVADLCEGLRRNRSLKRLTLSGNFLGVTGGRLVAEFLEELLDEEGPAGPSSLEELDVSLCGIGFKEVRHLAKIAGFKAVYTRSPASPQKGAPMIDVAGNFEVEEVWCAVTHGFMLFLSFIGSSYMFWVVSWSPVHHILGAGIFCFSLMICFASSTFYHSFFLCPTTNGALQMMDHVSIYVLIAGSYTPFLLFHSDVPSHIYLLWSEWILCAVGIAMHIWSQYSRWGTSAVYVVGELMLYVCMGWAAVTVLPSFRELLPANAQVGLLVGGILYTAGVPFFVLADYRPIFHVIWHLFVAAAAICHWFAVKDAAEDAFLRAL